MSFTSHTMSMQQFTDDHDTEIPLPQSQDSIQCLKFAPNIPLYQQQGVMLALAYWDGSLLIYQI